MLVLGTGLTMVDVALTLDAAGIANRVVALSRRGLLPRPHVDAPPPSPLSARPAGRGSQLLLALRRRADAVGCRRAVDELSPHTHGMWLSATVEEQRRFILDLRPWWDVYRHGLAPPVAARIGELTASGRLRIEAGRLQDCRPVGGAIEVTWRARGSDRT